MAKVYGSVFLKKQVGSKFFENNISKDFSNQYL